MSDSRKKFGTFGGVFIPSILTILGVIMYLRLGWVLGNVGLVGTIAIVTMSTAITLLTALSIAATATNMRVGAGGAYYMVSRSFGVEAGAAVGLPLYLAQALGVSFYIAGFAESVHTLFPQIPPVAISAVSLTALALVSYFSTEAALKIQYLIFALIFASLVSFFLGAPPNWEAPTSTPPTVSFWVVFAVFFPAVTGIEAGISMSGDLKNPARSLPWGTLAAVLVGYIVYLCIPIFMAARVPAEVLRTNPMVMRDMAWAGALIISGVWGATLSSALGALLGAPRTLQALARDRVLPGFLGIGDAKTDAPKIATAVSFAVALVGVLLGDLNAIAPILSMFFLTSYGFLNLIAGLEGFIGSPSWRPKFRTPWILSLVGAGACFGTMFMINSGATFIAAFCATGVFFFMQRRHLNARWSDLRRGILAAVARSSIYSLAKVKKNAKSWRPNIMVFSGSPTSRWYLIELVDAITHGKGFLTVATVLPKTAVKEDRLTAMEHSIAHFLEKRSVPALVDVSVSEDVLTGIQSLVRSYGLGPLVPNTFVLGETEKKENYAPFAELIQLIYALKRNLVMVRQEKVQGPKRAKEKKIVVWWDEDRQGAAFMLALAYMLQTSPEWRGSALTLKTIVKTEEDQNVALENLSQFLAESRMDAEVEVLLESKDRGTLTTIRDNSDEADLVFVGMRAPEADESTEAYSEYYQDLLRRTKEYPMTCFVLAGEQIRFDEIFA